MFSSHYNTTYLQSILLLHYIYSVLTTILHTYIQSYYNITYIQYSLEHHTYV